MMKILSALGKTGSWLSAHWEPILAVANILLTAVIAIYAHNLTQNNNNLLEKEMYPHFRVIETVERQNAEGAYCDSVIRIRNYGGNYYKLDSKVSTYISFQVGNAEYLMPLAGYYFVSSRSYEGDIAATHFYQNNNLKIHALITAANKRLMAENHIGTYSAPVSFVKIEYQDVQGNYNAQYFNAADSALLDNAVGNKFVDNFNGYVEFNGNHYSFDIDELTEDMLYEFAVTDLKNSFLLMLE